MGHSAGKVAKRHVNFVKRPDASAGRGDAGDEAVRVADHERCGKENPPQGDTCGVGILRSPSQADPAH